LSPNARSQRKRFKGHSRRQVAGRTGIFAGSLSNSRVSLSLHHPFRASE
jgi:hypothetical protein